VGVTRRSIRARSCYPLQAGVVICHDARRVWHMFLQSRYKVGLTLRVSRYKVDRSHKFIPHYKFLDGQWCSVAIQTISEPENCHGILDFNCMQMRESGCRNNFKFVLCVGPNAKTVTSPLIIPSVLAVGMLNLSRYNGVNIRNRITFKLSGYTELSRDISSFYFLSQCRIIICKSE
jgi:hypothetical protein